MQKPRQSGAFFYIDADALYAFKSRGFGGEIGLEGRLQNKRIKNFRNSGDVKNSIENNTTQQKQERVGDKFHLSKK